MSSFTVKVGICLLLMAMQNASATTSVDSIMANEFLVAKWKIWYKSLDVNHDRKVSIEDAEECRSLDVSHGGKISIEDVQESRKTFAELSGLQGDQAKSVDVGIEGWWNQYIFRGQVGEISETQFVDALNKDYTSDKSKFNDTMNKCFYTIFDVIDINNDGIISKEEFLNLFQEYGHDNVALDTSFFKMYNPTNGLVPLRDIADSWIDFVCNSDSSKPSVVKKGFEAGV